MAAQPIYPDDLKHELNSLFVRITRYMDGQRDAIMTQMEVDKQELSIKIDKLQTEASQLNQRVSNLESTQAQLIENQNILMTTFQTTTQAIVKQMQDNHAEVMGEIGDVKLRLVKLENKDN